MKHLIVLFLFIGLSACDSPNVYKENVDFEGALWPEKTEARFELYIPEANKPYDVYYNLRNNKAYPYYNIYLSRFLMDSTGKTLIDSKMNDQAILFDTKTGKPLGSGLGDIFDHKILIAKGYKFPYAGKYFFRIRQQMRVNPLPEVVSIGLTVETQEKSE